MQSKKNFSPKDFETFLAWLDSDQEKAAEKYERNRLRLIKYFLRKHVPDPEELTDRTLDRAILKIARQGKSSVDASTYLLGVARSVLLESLRSKKYLADDTKLSLPRLSTAYAIDPLDDASEWLYSSSIPLHQLQRFRIRVPRTLELTPSALVDKIGPYLVALESLEYSCRAVKGQTRDPVIVRSLTYYSPVSIGIQGAGEAYNAVKEDLIPWRRANAKKMAELEIRSMEESVKRDAAETLEKKARASKDRAEAAKYRAEARKATQEALKLSLENERLRFELQKDRLELAVSLVEKMNPSLPESEKYAHAFRMLPSIAEIIDSDLLALPS
jgi:hypothetical protein